MGQKIYFPNLNGLRFIAAAMVIIHHIEQFKSLFAYPNSWGGAAIVYLGKLGVILFFVLSGFLITYLLLAEEKQEGRISIKDFYIRRILRIWPLYFLIVVLALGVLPFIDFFTINGFNRETIYDNFFLKIGLFLFVLPNVLRATLGIVPYASHTWSIGTEEQFYIAWPVLLNFFRKRRITLMLVIIAAYISVYAFFFYGLDDQYKYKMQLILFWRLIPIDCMAIGGIYATMLFQEHRFIKYLLRLDVFIIVALTTITMLLFGVNFEFLNYEVYSVLFGFIILNLAKNPRLKNTLEFKPLNYLGRISYGLYMYHSIAIVISIRIVQSTGSMNNWLLYPVTFGITIIMAGLSYKYFESYFLKLKSRFTKINSSTKP